MAVGTTFLIRTQAEVLAPGAEADDKTGHWAYFSSLFFFFFTNIHLFKTFIYKRDKVPTSMGDSRLIVSESEVTFVIRCTRKLGFMIWAPRKICRSGHGEVSTANKGTDGAGLVGGDIFQRHQRIPGSTG